MGMEVIVVVDFYSMIIIVFLVCVNDFIWIGGDNGSVVIGVEVYVLVLGWVIIEWIEMYVKVGCLMVWYGDWFIEWIFY